MGPNYLQRLSVDNTSMQSYQSTTTASYFIEVMLIENRQVRIVLLVD